MFINTLEILKLITDEIFGDASSVHKYSVVYAMNAEADRLNDGKTDYAGVIPSQLEGGRVEIAELFDQLPVTFTVDEPTKPLPIPDWVPLTHMVLICGQDPKRLRHTLKILMDRKPVTDNGYSVGRESFAWLREQDYKFYHKQPQWPDLYETAIKSEPTHTGLFFHEGNLIWRSPVGYQFIMGGKHNENVKIK